MLVLQQRDHVSRLHEQRYQMNGNKYEDGNLDGKRVGSVEIGFKEL